MNEQRKRDAARAAVAILTVVVGDPRGTSRDVDAIIDATPDQGWVLASMAGIFANVLDELEEQRPGLTATWLRDLGLSIETLEIP